MKLTFGQRLAAHLHEVLVMGEEKNLGPLGQGAQMRNDRRGPPVIEGDQQVVENQGHGLVLFEIPIQRRQPERQIQLIAGPIAESLDPDFLLIGPDTDEHRDIIIIEFRAQSGECTAGEAAEDFARFLEQRTLILLPDQAIET